jgi:hypothetical protein
VPGAAEAVDALAERRRLLLVAGEGVEGVAAERDLVNPFRGQTPSLPGMPGALLSLLAEAALTGGQNLKQPFALVHFGWRLESPLRVYTARPRPLTTMSSCTLTALVLITLAFLAIFSVNDLAIATPTSAAVPKPAAATTSVTSGRRIRARLSGC